MKLGTNIVVGGVAVMFAACASTSFAWSHNEHNVNTTGATARGVVKVLDGRYDISDQMTWDFSTVSWSQREVPSAGSGQWQTILRWDASGAEAVANGAVGDACFTAVPTAGSGSPPYAQIVGAWWTDVSGAPIGTFPTPGASMVADFPLNPVAPNDPVVPIVHIGNNQQAIVPGSFDPLTGEFDVAPFNPGEGAIHIEGPIVAGIFDAPVGPFDLWFEEVLATRPDRAELELQGVRALAPDSFFDIWLELEPSGQPAQLVQLDPGQALEAFTFDPLQPGVQLPLPELLPGHTLVALVDLGDGNFDSFSFTAPVPEPATLGLLAGTVLIGLRRRGR